MKEEQLMRTSIRAVAIAASPPIIAQGSKPSGRDHQLGCPEISSTAMR
jgi:hypothetical protein